MEDTGAYLKADPCIKCGHRNVYLDWSGQIIKQNVATTEPEFIGGWMEAVCERCSYRWTVTPLDADGS